MHAQYTYICVYVCVCLVGGHSVSPLGHCQFRFEWLLCCYMSSIINPNAIIWLRSLSISLVNACVRKCMYCVYVFIPIKSFKTIFAQFPVSILILENCFLFFFFVECFALFISLLSAVYCLLCVLYVCAYVCINSHVLAIVYLNIMTC